MIRLGIIGCGRILPAHLDGLRRLKERGAAEFVVTALCARKREDAEMFRRRGEGPPPEIFVDYRELIAADVADAFLVTTSLETHHDIGVRALEAGKHVLTEKPLAITVRAA